MPVLNKLEYLDETKQQIKNALNTNFDTQIGDNDTFRSYVDKIKNIYENWSKVTGIGTDLTLNNTKNGKMAIIPEGNASQDGSPTADTPIPIKVVTGEQNVGIKNSDSTLSQNYPLSLGNIELFRNYTDSTKIYTDYIFKNKVGNPYYNSNLEEDSWYKCNRNRKVELKNYNYTSSVTKRTNTILFLGNVTGKIHSRYYCNILSNYHYNTLINSDIEGIGHGGGYADRLYISVNKNRLEGYTDELTNSQLNTLLKKFLEDNNAYAWYALRTPTYEKTTDTTLIQQLENMNNNARSYKDTTIIECTSESDDNEVIVANVSALMKGVQ